MTQPATPPVTEPVFHIALATDWAAALQAGEYRISTLGRTLDEQGYIHASFAHQVAGVFEAFYGAVTEPLVLLHLDAAALPIVLEPAVPGGAEGTPGAALFPHIYGPLPVGAVLAVQAIPDPGTGSVEPRAPH